MSIDKNDRHSGCDEKDAPLLGDGEVVASEGDVVIGGKDCDQADDKAADGLGGPEAIEPEGAEVSLGKQIR